MGNVIFDDLEIDYSNMMKDPESFDRVVKAKADELKGILKSSTSIQSYIDGQKNTDDMEVWNKKLNNLYEEIDSEMSIRGMLDLAKSMRKLAQDIENMARSKATYDLAANQNVMDKSMAHTMYVRLREAFNVWANAMKVLDIYEATPLPAMPGNYGTQVGLVFHYVFQFEGEDEGMMNPYAVCKKLGIEKMGFMDTVEYLEAHPELGVTVTKLTK